MKIQKTVFDPRQLKQREGGRRLGYTPVARSPWRLNVLRWLLIFVGPLYGTDFVSLFWRLDICARIMLPNQTLRVLMLR
jgi:hypothetical protein